jgi:hypothetical protein
MRLADCPNLTGMEMGESIVLADGGHSWMSPEPVDGQFFFTAVCSVRLGQGALRWPFTLDIDDLRCASSLSIQFEMAAGKAHCLLKIATFEFSLEGVQSIQAFCAALRALFQPVVEGDTAEYRP